MTGLRLLAAESASLELIPLPAEIDVVPEYALTILGNARNEAASFQSFVMSASGQELIAAAGFVPAA